MAKYAKWSCSARPKHLKSGVSSMPYCDEAVGLCIDCLSEW